MRILYEQDLAGSKYHGMAFRIYQFSKEFVDNGHEVMVVAASYSHARKVNPNIKASITNEFIDGIHYKWIKTPRYSNNGISRVFHMLVYNWRLWKNASKIAEEFNPDIVISSGVTPLDFRACHEIAKKAKAKIVYEVGDLWPLTPIELGGYSPKHPFIQIMQKAEDYVYKHTDIVISKLPCAEEYMNSRGLAKKKFYYLPNGIIESDWESPSPLPEIHLKILNHLKNERKFLIGYAGSHSLANSVSTLLDVASGLINRPNLHFVLVGNGPLKSDLILKAKKRGLNNITFLDSISKTSIPSFLNLMDVLYIGFKKQSLYRFGISPNKIFDYMMSAKPIIQAIEAGNNLVKDAQCGFSVEPESVNSITEAIIALESITEEERQIMGKNGKDYVLKYHSYSILTKRFLEILKKTINHGFELC